MAYNQGYGAGYNAGYGGAPTGYNQPAYAPQPAYGGSAGYNYNQPMGGGFGQPGMYNAPVQEPCCESLGCRIAWDLFCYSIVSNGFWILATNISAIWIIGSIICFILQIWALWMLCVACGSTRNSSTHSNLTTYGQFRKWFIYIAGVAAIVFIIVGLIFLFSSGGTYSRETYVWTGIVMLIDAVICLLAGYSVYSSFQYFLNKVNAQHGGNPYIAPN